MQNTPLQTAAGQQEDQPLLAPKSILLPFCRKEKSHHLPGRRSKFDPQIILVKPRLKSEWTGVLGGGVRGGGNLGVKITSRWQGAIPAARREICMALCALGAPQDHCKLAWLCQHPWVPAGCLACGKRGEFVPGPGVPMGMWARKG